MLIDAIVTVAGMRCWRESVVNVHATAGAWWSTGGVGCWSGDVATDGDEGGRRMLGEEARPGAGGRWRRAGLLMLAARCLRRRCMTPLYTRPACGIAVAVTISISALILIKAGFLLSTPLNQFHYYSNTRFARTVSATPSSRLCTEKRRFRLDLASPASCGTRADCCPFHSRQPQRLDFVLAWGPLSRIGVLEVLLARLASTLLY